MPHAALMLLFASRASCVTRPCKSVKTGFRCSIIGVSLPLLPRHIIKALTVDCYIVFKIKLRVMGPCHCLRRGARGSGPCEGRTERHQEPLGLSFNNCQSRTDEPHAL